MPYGRAGEGVPGNYVLLCLVSKPYVVPGNIRQHGDDPRKVFGRECLFLYYHAFISSIYGNEI